MNLHHSYLEAIALAAMKKKTKIKLQKLHALKAKLHARWRNYQKLPTTQCREEFFKKARTYLRALAVDLAEIEMFKNLQI